MVILSYKMSDVDNVVTKLLVGGSVISKRPVFSSDGKYLYVMEQECVRSYSTQTGGCVMEYRCDEVPPSLVGIDVIGQHLYGVTSSNALVKWSIKLSSPMNVIQLQNSQKESNTLHGLTAFDIRIVNHVNGDDNSDVEMCIMMSSGSHNSTVTILRYNALKLKVGNQFSVRANDNEHSIAFGGQYNCKFVATISNDVLSVYEYGSSEVFKSFESKHLYWTAVRAHETEDCVIGATAKGVVLIYYSVLAKGRGKYYRGAPTHCLCAWHILPVSDIVFSTNGSRMFSGGGECVLVQWNMNTDEGGARRQYLPRLPAPLVHLTMSPLNSQVAVTLLDNSVLLINAQMSVEHSIQAFTWGLMPVPGQPLFPAGICRDPNSDCLVLNGRPGHVQFFSLNTNTMTHNLDVTQTNYITQERDTNILNVDITNVAISKDGKWMATVQARDDRETSFELALKFWMFDQANDRYQLNTFCDVPHQKKINCMKFQPSRDKESRQSDKDSDHWLITTGDDNKFRLWSTSTDFAKHTTWKCDRIGFYKDYPAGPACFSSDGSVLAVGFGPCMTIWDVDSHQLVASLARNKDTLTFVELDQKTSSHLAVCTDAENLYVWNLLTLSVVWFVPLRVSTLIADPLSDFMVAFTADNHMYVFKSSSDTPVYQKSNVSRDKVLSAIFVPRDHTEKTIVGLPAWLHRSQLLFITAAQELMSVEVDDGQHDSHSHLKKFKNAEDDVIKTPYAMLHSEESKSRLAQSTSPHKHHSTYGSRHKMAIRELLQPQVHTMTHMSLLCEDFLNSFIGTYGSTKPTKVKKVKQGQNKFDEFVKSYNSRVDEFANEMESFRNMAHTSADGDEDASGISDSDLDVEHQLVTDESDSDAPSPQKSKVKNVKVKNKVNQSKFKVIKCKKYEGQDDTEFCIDQEPDLHLLNLFKDR